MKRREMERSGAEGKTEASVVSRIAQRTEIVSYTLLAEASHFHEQRIKDYNQAIKIFLREQIAYYQKVRNIQPSDSFHQILFRWFFPYVAFYYLR